VIRLMLAASVAAAITTAVPAEPEFRGAWVNIGSFRTAEDCDRLIANCVRAHLNVLWPIAYEYGYVYYRSDLLAMNPAIAEGYDPLGTLIRKAHAAGIQVHPWYANFISGPTDPKSDSLMARHPEWIVLDAAGRRPQGRASICPQRDDVRKLEADLMLEVARKYKVEGLHFDYIRYLGSQWCFCETCRQKFKQLTGLEPPMEPSAYAGNPLVEPGTAKVLAKFGDGVPAVLLNQLGKGTVVMLNWCPPRAAAGFADNVFGRALKYLEAVSRPRFVLRSATNATRYGYREHDIGVAWLKAHGLDGKDIPDEGIAGLPDDAFLLIPYVYLFNEQMAQDLADLIERGGNALVIDGPTPTINKLPDLQRAYGMKRAGAYFHDATTIVVPAEHPLVGPAGERTVSAELYEKWVQFRCDGITSLVRDVYHRARKLDADLRISAAVFVNPASARTNVGQDWPAWVKQSIIDVVAPMNYTSNTEQMCDRLRNCLAATTEPQRVFNGICAYVRGEDGKAKSRSTDLVLEQVARTRELGCKGLVFFDAGWMSDELYEALGKGPFSESVPPWYP